MKRCKKCGETKPLDDFYREKGCRDGHRPECKACNLAAKKAWYQRNREHAIAKAKRWQQENPERHNATQRAYRAANPDRLREGHLRRKFGITIEDYAAMLEAQGGGCAICGRPEPEGGSLHVDHDHVTGRVRGLLCFRCNGALGNLDEDVDRLADAMAYLDRAADDGSDAALARTRTAALVSP